MTLEQRLAQIEAVPNVAEAAIVVTPREITAFSSIKYAKIDWIIDDGSGVGVRNGAELFVKNAGLPEESALWSGSIPAILQPAPKFLTSRTTGGWGDLSSAQQIAAIQNFCNEVYKAKEPGAGNIREFGIAAVDGTTVRVSGFFNTPDAQSQLTQWVPKTWFVRLIDANGSVASPYTNVEFHLIAG